MPLILSVDTSTKVCSVALHKDGELLANQNVYLPNSHSAYLTLIVEQLIKQSGVSFDEIDAYAVGMGPGSYTGLRIGVSTIKGYCYAKDKPLIAVNSLESMAKSVEVVANSDVVLCPMIDARRMEVYCLFTKNGEVIIETNNEIIEEGTFSELLDQQKVLFFGDGAEKCKATLTHKNAQFVDGISSNASGVGVIATEKYKNKEFEDVAYFEPFYLKEFLIKPSTKKLL